MTSGLVSSKLGLAKNIFKKETIKVGVIGVNGMGWSNLQAILEFPKVKCTALCDVDKRILKKRQEELGAKDGSVELFADYKNMLEGDLVDVVIIGVPDHWHYLMFSDALDAGKHIYVEKPIANSIEEIQLMESKDAKSNKIVQVGQWQRSLDHFKEAIEYVHSGRLGQIRLVKAWAYQGWMKNIEPKEDTSPPKEVDYKRWLGPAPRRTFNPNRFHFDFRWFWDYAGGLMTDWGVHLLDYALLGMKADYPKSVMSIGGKLAYPDGAAETPDTLTTVYEFDDFTLQWEHATGIDLGPYERDHGIGFIGNKGTLVLDRNGWEVLPEKDGDGKDKIEAVPVREAKNNGLKAHMENFLEAIEKNDKGFVHAGIDVGAFVAVVAQMGNIAYRTGKKLFWDKKQAKFSDDEANELIKSKYHNGYKL